MHKIFALFVRHSWRRARLSCFFLLTSYSLYSDQDYHATSRDLFPMPLLSIGSLLHTGMSIFLPFALFPIRTFIEDHQ